VNQVTLLSWAFEATNGFLLIVEIGVIWFFADYLRRRLREGAKWRNINLAVGLLLIVLGDLIIRVPVWWYRHLYNRGQDVFSVVAFTAVVCAGAAVAAGGSLYTMSVATREHHRPWPALLTLLGACAFTAASLWW
jgi:hypothetical protein